MPARDGCSTVGVSARSLHFDWMVLMKKILVLLAAAGAAAALVQRRRQAAAAEAALWDEATRTPTTPVAPTGTPATS
ncbi:DLW-39 family protein [Nakamurella sp. GG22]